MIKFTWTDFPEKYDSLDYMDSCHFNVNIPAPHELKSHLLIKSDNYPALYHLEKQYRNSIDLIYIDPPYNTGNNFTYNDKFSSNTDDTHSSWLSFISRRLKIAKNLLTDSGCIFIAIGQEELFTLKILCDQIFGEENYINDFMWLHGKGKKNHWSRTMEQHTLCYAKNRKKLNAFCDSIQTDWATKNVDNDPRGNWFSGSISFTEKRSSPNHPNYFTIKSPSGIEWTRQWLTSKDEMNKLLLENKIFFGTAPEYDKVPRVKIFNNEKKEIIPQNLIDCVESTREAQNHLDTLLGTEKVFDNPKPVDLISRLIFITQMKKDALIMDFFAGSGTTFEAVLSQNVKDGGSRKCILIQKDETFVTEKGHIRKGSEKAFSAGFESIFDICKMRVEKSLENYKKEYPGQFDKDFVTILNMVEK